MISMVQPGLYGPEKSSVPLCTRASGGGDDETAFGYVNLPDALMGRVRVVEQELRVGARLCGWSLGTVFHEERPESSEAFEWLRMALERRRTRRVVIASFTHFSSRRLVQDLMVQSLENDLDADVIALDEDLVDVLVERDPVPNLLGCPRTAPVRAIPTRMV